MQLVVVTVLLLVIVSISADDVHNYRTHNRMLARYPCKRPQPRVIELEDLKNNQELMEIVNIGRRDTIKPAVTVLHRCQSSGCCKSAEERCVPIATKDVHLTFAISNGSLTYVHVKETEHTHCGCEPISNNDVNQ